MKLVKQSYEILEQKIPVHKMDDYSDSHFREEYMNNMYKHIEKCGRTCYKSEDKITEDSARRFVDGLIKSKHLSVLEHGVVYLKMPFICDSDINFESDNHYRTNKYSKYNLVRDNEKTFWHYITTNYRVIIENGWEDDLQYLCEPKSIHKKRHTVLLHSCIHTYKDLTRHRKASFSIESTRYCNYSKTDKFGEMKFVEMPWVLAGNDDWNQFVKREIIRINDTEHDWKYYTTSDGGYILSRVLNDIEDAYNKLIQLGWQPQQAAEILPQCTAADIVMTAFDSDWKFIFDLRSDTAATGKPHPLVEELMTPLRDEFKKNNWI